MEGEGDLGSGKCRREMIDGWMDGYVFEYRYA